MRRAVFLDRDGTIIFDRGYLADPAGVALLPGAARALRSLRDAGFALVIISNQSGVARGLIAKAQHEAVHARCVEVLREAGVEIDGAYYCFHGPDDACSCRKPRPGMLEAAARDLHIDLGASFMVGDKPSDVDAGRAAGCTAVLFEDWSRVSLPV